MATLWSCLVNTQTFPICVKLYCGCWWHLPYMYIFFLMFAKAFKLILCFSHISVCTLEIVYSIFDDALTLNKYYSMEDCITHSLVVVHGAKKIKE